jgi:alkylated DNA repair dioxygenase AlkB
MNLFNQSIDMHKNWLPFDGTVNYYGQLWTEEEADIYLNRLLKNIAWRNDELMMFGKKIVTKRKVGWYGEKPFKYTYSNTTKQALPWTEELMELKAKIEKKSGETFNSCLLNLYHSGDEGMGWHTDAEPELKKDGAIASLSFGANRRFVFRHIESKEKVELILEHGSLLIMKNTTQTFWQHTLPKTKKVTTPRINLTFRTIVE